MQSRQTCLLQKGSDEGTSKCDAPGLLVEALFSKNKQHSGWYLRSVVSICFLKFLTLYVICGDDILVGFEGSKLEWGDNADTDTLFKNSRDGVIFEAWFQNSNPQPSSYKVWIDIVAK